MISEAGIVPLGSPGVGHEARLAVHGVTCFSYFYIKTMKFGIDVVCRMFCKFLTSFDIL